MLMGVKETREIIPYRRPLLLVNCIEELESDVCTVGYRCVAYGESFFKRHFLQESVMPGMLLVEALAQTGVVAILSQERFRGKVAYLGGIERAELKRKVVPGGRVKLGCEVTKQRGPVGVDEATAAVDGKLAVNAELTFMVGQGIEGECRCLTRF